MLMMDERHGGLNEDERVVYQGAEILQAAAAP